MFEMLFDVGGVSSFRAFCSLPAVPLWLQRRLKEGDRMKRTNYWQQKLPLSLHKMGILEGSEIFVCSKLHNTAQIQVNSIHLQTSRIAGQIWGDAKLLGAPVAKVFEDWDQCLAGGAERAGDLRRRGAHCPSVDDTIPFHGSHPPVLQNVVSTCPFTLCRLNKFIETS